MPPHDPAGHGWDDPDPPDVDDAMAVGLAFTVLAVVVIVVILMVVGAVVMMVAT